MTEPQTPPPEPALLALAAAYQAQTLSLRNRLTAFVLATWRSFANHDDKALAGYLAAVVPATTGAQLQMSSLTTAFLAHQQQLGIGGRFAPVALDPKMVTGSAVRIGVTSDEADARPFYGLWKDLHAAIEAEAETIRQEAVQNALAVAEQRAVSIATTDLQLAKTHTQQMVGERDKRAIYARRILEGESSCGLCIVASTQRYNPTELMPIHPGCDCSWEIVYSDTEPGRILDLNTLQNVHDRIEQRFGGANSAARVIDSATDANGLPLLYRDVLVVHEHGEIGPVLGVRGQNFTGPANLP